MCASAYRTCGQCDGDMCSVWSWATWSYLSSCWTLVVEWLVMIVVMVKVVAEQMNPIIVSVHRVSLGCRTGEEILLLLLLMMMDWCCCFHLVHVVAVDDDLV